MRMLKHRLKLLALIGILAAAPASVGHSSAALSTSTHHWDCPDEARAELAAAGYEMLPVSTQGEPAEGSLFDPGRRALLAP
jgi:hypothetical protein